MPDNKYNPFNPLKTLKHVPYWQSIPDNIPPPVFATVDPINACNFKCRYCNSQIVRNKNIEMDAEYLIYLAKFLADWGVKAICIAGGGEPLLNQNVPLFLDECKKRNVETAIVTNGSKLSADPSLLGLTWLGISIDASSDETLTKLKGTPRGMYERIIDNVAEFVEYKNEMNSTVQVGYKFLIHPYNYDEIMEASEIAKEIGCDLIHLRPAGNAWFNLNHKEDIIYTQGMINVANHQIRTSKKLFEDDRFQIYNTMYKFTDQWQPNITYKKCYALYTNCYFSPDKKVRLCCDRRGDKDLELCDIGEVKTAWGSEKHKNIVDSIDISKCPRCTYAHINEIFENVILEDRMMCNFI